MVVITNPNPYSAFNPEVHHTSCSEYALDTLTTIFSKCVGESTNYFNFISQISNSFPLSGCLNKLRPLSSDILPRNFKLLEFYSNALNEDQAPPSWTDDNPLDPKLSIEDLAKKYDLICVDEIIKDAAGNKIFDAHAVTHTYNGVPKHTEVYPLNFFLNINIDLSPTSKQLDPFSESYSFALNEGLHTLCAHTDFDPNMIGQNTFTPLTFAVQSRCYDGINTLLSHPKIDPNQIDGEGQSPLQIASAFGYEDVVKLLLDHPKIDPNQKAGLNGHERTPLEEARRAKHYEVEAILIAHMLKTHEKA